jgi:bifunctional DNase/RNase
MKLQGASAPRPLTHDLLVNMLGELDVDVVRVTVTELRENTFHASITIAQNGAEVEIDSRSSDAIAIAVRAQAPIFAADDVIEESAIEMEGDEVNEEEIVDEFKRFLDKVSAEDFVEAEVEGDVGETEDVEVEPEEDEER